VTVTRELTKVLLETLDRYPKADSSEKLAALDAVQAIVRGDAAVRRLPEQVEAVVSFLR